MSAVIIRYFLHEYDNASGIRQNPSAEGHQFSADEPHPASADESPFRLVQPDRGAVAGASLDRDLAGVRRSRPERSANATLPELACVLHARTEARRAPDRPRAADHHE